jgi:hypothetical protein
LRSAGAFYLQISIVRGFHHSSVETLPIGQSSMAAERLPPLQNTNEWSKQQPDSAYIPADVFRKHLHERPIGSRIIARTSQNGPLPNARPGAVRPAGPRRRKLQSRSRKFSRTSSVSLFRVSRSASAVHELLWLHDDKPGNYRRMFTAALNVNAMTW